MTLQRMVVDLICERGCGTVDHLEPTLIEYGFNRVQINKALHNAKNMGYLWCEPHAKRPFVYWPGKKQADPMFDQLIPKRAEPPRMFVRWAFDAATPTPEDAMPKHRGTVHAPLGPWNEKEAA